MRTSPEGLLGIAPKSGFEWQDSNVLLACGWFAELANKRTWEQRKEETRRSFLIAKESWSRGEPVPFYNPADTASWSLFQGNPYATDRMNWVPEEAVRIVPTLTRIGEAQIGRAHV